MNFNGEIKYSDEQEYIESLEKMFDKLCKRNEYIKELTAIYGEVYITIYIRSEFNNFYVKKKAISQ